MTRLQRRTPCVGICSTTYGDLVCRGCKRFAHEIVDWNRYSDEQRENIEARLQQIKAGVVSQFVTLTDATACASVLGLEQQPLEQQGPDALLLQVYDQLTRARSASDNDVRPQLAVELSAEIDSVAALRKAVDAEFLSRSKAVYEHHFKVTVD